MMICGLDTNYDLYKCLCTNDNYMNFPDIKIQLGNNQYNFPKESYILKVDIIL